MTREGLQGSSHIRNIAILVCAVCAVYGMTLGNGFVWDDHAIVQGRSVYRTFDLRAMFLSLGNGIEYLPLRDVSYAIDYRLWGEQTAAGFHASNVLIYAVSMLLVYLLTLALLRQLYPDRSAALQRRTALPVTLLYALHPIQAQAVSFITCRNVLLSGLLCYAAALLYLRVVGNESRRPVVAYGGALCCFVLALLSKATVIVLPLLLCLMEWARPGELRTKVARVAPFFLIAGGFYALFRKVAFGSGIARESVAAADSWWHKCAVAGQIPWFYLKKLLIPAGFAAEYADTFSRSSDWRVYTALLGLAVLGGAAWCFRKRAPLLWYGLLWFCAALLPVLNFFATNPVVADRYAFLPAYGFCLMAGALLIAAENRPLPVNVAQWLGVAVMAVITVSTVRIWRSDVTLWEATVKAEPGLAKGYTNLGWSYFHNREYDQAFVVFRRGEQLNPASIDYELAVGYRQYLDRNFPEAVVHFWLALQKKPDALYPLYLLSRAYLSLGDRQQAANTLQRIISSPEVDFSGYRPKARVMLEQLQRDAGQPLL